MPLARRPTVALVGAVSGRKSGATPAFPRRLLQRRGIEGAPSRFPLLLQRSWSRVRPCPPQQSDPGRFPAGPAQRPWPLRSAVLKWQTREHRSVRTCVTGRSLRSGPRTSPRAARASERRVGCSAAVSWARARTAASPARPWRDRARRAARFGDATQIPSPLATAVRPATVLREPTTHTPAGVRHVTPVLTRASAECPPAKHARKTKLHSRAAWRAATGVG